MLLGKPWMERDRIQRKEGGPRTEKERIKTFHDWENNALDRRT
jgi:hypothetical protein